MHMPSEFRPKPERMTRKDHILRVFGAHLDVFGVKSSMHLAEGAGSVAAFFIHTFGTESCYYNSLVDIKTGTSHRFAGFVPPALVPYLGSVQIQGHEFCNETGGDLLNPNTVKQYVLWMK